MPKFVISTPFDFKKSEPLKLEAKDRLDAICSVGFTVWAEEEWNTASGRAKEILGVDFPVPKGLHE